MDHRQPERNRLSMYGAWDSVRSDCLNILPVMALNVFPGGLQFVPAAILAYGFLATTCWMPGR